MFDIGFAELLIIAVVALLVLGPDKLPAAARMAGLWVGRIQRTLGGIQSEITEELRVDEMRRAMNAQQGTLDKMFNDVSGDDVRASGDTNQPDRRK